jgi:hypothetical protein
MNKCLGAIELLVLSKDFFSSIMFVVSPWHPVLPKMKNTNVTNDKLNFGITIDTSTPFSIQENHSCNAPPVLSEFSISSYFFLS